MVTFVNTFTAAANANQAYKNSITAAENFISSHWTNSITLGGGESNDVILDASDAGCNFDGSHTGCGATLYPAGSVFYLYEPDLYRLSNDAENFGGMMTEVHICKSVTPAGALSKVGDTFGNVCN